MKPLDLAAESTSPAEVLSWLQILNSPDLDFDLDVNAQSYSADCHQLRQFRQREPEFSIAAASWPQYAVRYWDTLQKEILHLFDPASERHNFKQWVLEYAKVTQPKKYRLPIGVSNAFVQLAEALALGLVSPLHMAAVLAIPPLVQKLLLWRNSADDTIEMSVLGPPIFCALVGPGVLEFGTTPCNWTDVFKAHLDRHRADVIELLLGPGDVDCEFRYDIRNELEWGFPLAQELDDPGRGVSLFGLAFWASASLDEPRILDEVARRGTEFDYHALFVVCNAQDCMLLLNEEQRQSFRKTLEQLALWIQRSERFDLPPDAVMNDAYPQTLLAEIMDRYGAQMPQEAPLWTTRVDGAFVKEIETAIRDGCLFDLERLKHDSQFDPNMHIPIHGGTTETLFHAAVSAGQLRSVEFLIRAGADCTLIDNDGRTPVMVIETPEMLDLMHLKHKIPISDTDSMGHNLWHYACSCHDLALLEWLCQYDPDKTRHMQASDSGSRQTPLDMALFSIADAPTFQSVKDATVPVRLVREMQASGVSVPGHFKAHAAGPWGNLDLTKGLAAIGANFGEIDLLSLDEVSHRLNPLATPELVRELAYLQGSKPAKVNRRGHTPAGAMIHTIVELHTRALRNFGSSNFQPCHATLLRETMAELLRAEDTVELRKNTWKTACDAINEGYRDAKNSSSDTQSIVDASLLAALTALIDVESHRTYQDAAPGEDGTLMGLKEVTRYGAGPWSLVKAPWFLTVLKCCDKDRLQQFYKTDSAARLLKRACEHRQWDTFAFLAQTGIFLDDSRKFLPGLDFVTCLVGNEEPQQLVSLLKSPAREHLLVAEGPIYQRLINAGDPEDRSNLLTLTLLLRAGLSPNPKPWNGKPVVPLGLAIHPCPLPLFVKLLLNYGADPSIGHGSWNMFLLAACLDPLPGGDDLAIMKSLIDVFERHDQPPFNWNCEAASDPGCTWNALQTAAQAGNERMLQLLLGHTPLRNSVNGISSRNSRTPAHHAAEHGHVECVEVLAAWGADLGLLDDEGLTPRELAHRTGHISVCEAIDRLTLGESTAKREVIELHMKPW